MPELHPAELNLAQRARAATGLKQEDFAITYRISLSTLHNNEQERATPRGAAKRYFQLIEEYPEQVRAMIATIIPDPVSPP